MQQDFRNIGAGDFWNFEQFQGCAADGQGGCVDGQEAVNHSVGVQNGKGHFKTVKAIFGPVAKQEKRAASAIVGGLDLVKFNGEAAGGLGGGRDWGYGTDNQRQGRYRFSKIHK